MNLLGIPALPKELQEDVTRALAGLLVLVEIGLVSEVDLLKSGPIDFGLGMSLADAIRPFIRHTVSNPIENALRYYFRTEVPAVRQILTAVREGGLDEDSARTALRRTGLADVYLEPLLMGALKTKQVNDVKAKYDQKRKALDEAMADWEAYVKPVEDDLNWVISELRSLDRLELNDSYAEAVDYDKDELSDVESVYRARRRKELAAKRKASSA
jgi:hypothetical protein